MNVILCGSTFPPSRGILAPLLPDDEVVVVERPDLESALRTADVVIPMMTRLDAGLIGLMSARLIQQWGAGLEGVDVAAANSRGILVCNVPSDETPNAESTAEHAVLLMLACARRLKVAFRSFERGLWGAPLGESLVGKRAFIVGFGRIGKAVARRLVALGMEVDAIRSAPAPEEARNGVGEVGGPDDLLRLARAADFLVCAATATATSRGMLNERVFRAMKPGAFVINVARGAVIDEPALVAALREERLAGAGLDVYAEEPARLDNPLLHMENVIATPHIAGVTRQSYEGIARVIAANVNRVRVGRPPDHCVNLEQLQR